MIKSISIERRVITTVDTNNVSSVIDIDNGTFTSDGKCLECPNVHVQFYDDAICIVLSPRRKIVVRDTAEGYNEFSEKAYIPQFSSFQEDGTHEYNSVDDWLEALGKVLNT